MFLLLFALNRGCDYPSLAHWHQDGYPNPITAKLKWLLFLRFALFQLPCLNTARFLKIAHENACFVYASDLFLPFYGVCDRRLG